MAARATREAADFYLEAKAMFDGCLGPDHPVTQEWKKSLFFLINAPAIQKMTEAAAREALFGAHSVAHAQWLNTLAAASDAARFLRKSRDNFCITLGADGAVCQGTASPTARMFARHAKLAVLGAGGTLVTTHHTRSY